MTDTKTEKEGFDSKSLNLYQKLAAITGEIGNIAKSGKNAEQGYNFIEYAAVAGSLRALFAKYNVMVIPIMKTDTRKVETVTTRRGGTGFHVVQDFEFKFVNCDDPKEVEIIPWSGEAIDYGDKAINKTATGALKYCLMRTFNVSEKGDEDPDQHTAEVVHADPEPEPRKVTLKDAIVEVMSELVGKGFKSADDRKHALLTIAGVQDQSELTPENVQHARDVITEASGDELRGYLKAKESEAVDVVHDVPLDEPINLDEIDEPFDH